MLSGLKEAKKQPPFQDMLMKNTLVQRGNCQPHGCEFALYFAMEQTNLGESCLRLKQTEILLNVWSGKDVTDL